MFLPNTLPAALLQLRKKTKFVKKAREVNNNQVVAFPISTSARAMVSLRKKRNHNSNASEATIVGAAPTSSNPTTNRSLLTRGWERLSRRKKRAKQTAQPSPVRNEHSAGNAFPNAWEVNVASTSGGVQGNGTRDVQPHMNNNESGQRQNGSVNAGVVVLPDIHSITGEDTTRKHFLHRGMDRIRRSFRRGTSSTKKGQALTGGRASQAEKPGSSAGSSLNGGGLSSNGHHTGKNYCQPDEAAVRSAACSFNVKYLGCCEVYESRGMHVCESALQLLRAKKRTTKSILYVSGDGIRVVDQDNNRGGLILDQTIEKVSFCAPDRHNDKGFAYICRDGATRRWMCHGFQATKESGERLSHAVGCAFNVCLEKKKKRDAETAAYKSAQALVSANSGADTSGLNVDWDSVEPVGSAAQNNAAYSSFRRQLSIAERKIDPQTAIIHNPPPSTTAQQQPMAHAVPSQAARHSLTLSAHIGLNTSFSMDECSSVAKPRPVANPLLFERQGSFKAPVQPSSQPSSSFKRFNSLRSGFDLSAESQDMFASSASKTLNGVKTLHNEPIYEGDDDEVEWPHQQQSVDTEVRTTPPLAQRQQNIGAGNGVATCYTSSKLPNSHSLQHFGNNPMTNSQHQVFSSPLWSTSIRTTPAQNDSRREEKDGIGTDSSARPMQNSISLTGFDNGFAYWEDNQSAACTNRSSKADDWLEQAFKASMTFVSPSHSSAGLQQQSNSQRSFNRDAFCGSPPSQPPPLVSQEASPEKGLSLGEKHKLISAQKAIGPLSNQGHSRKTSGGAVRLSIEYQLLEETDAPPQSPPSSSKSVSFHVSSQQVQASTSEKPSFPNSSYTTPAKPKRSMQERTIYGDDDPFDVHWSTIVLQNSSSSKKKNNHCSSPLSSVRHSTSHNSLPSTTNNKLTNGVGQEESSLTPIKSLHSNPFSSESTLVNA